MMKRIFYIPVLIVSLLTACEERIPEPGINGGGNGEVLINILPPSITTGGNVLTRADWPSNGMPKVPMPDSSTIRLFIYKVTDKEINPISNNLLIDKEMTFRVRSKKEIEASSDKRALVPCQVDETTGKALADITDTDLHLPGSTYDFFAISPAVKLENEWVSGDYETPGTYPVPGARLRHGGIAYSNGVIATQHDGSPITLYTSQPVKGVEIKQSDPDISGAATPGVYNLQLEPFTLLTSRIKFIILRGIDVDSMKIEKRGVVMDSLTFNPYNSNFLIGDSILRETILYDDDAVYGSVSATNARNITGEPKVDEEGTYDKTDTWELTTEIIPNPKNGPTRKTDVVLTFHLLINGENYKSYETTLPNQQFQRGNEYTYEVTVNAGGIFVRGWRNVGWTATIPK